jgi:hypothetical protein
MCLTLRRRLGIELTSLQTMGDLKGSPIFIAREMGRGAFDYSVRALIILCANRMRSGFG